MLSAGIILKFSGYALSKICTTAQNLNLRIWHPPKMGFYGSSQQVFFGPHWGTFYLHIHGFLSVTLYFMYPSMCLSVFPYMSLHTIKWTSNYFSMHPLSVLCVAQYASLCSLYSSHQTILCGPSNIIISLWSVP